MNIFKHNIFLYTSSSSFFPARLWPLHGLGALLSGFDIASVRVLCQRHLDTLLGEAGDRTNNLQVTSQPALPPELLPPLLYSSECWTRTEKDLSKISAFHTRILRIIIRIF